MGDLKKFKISEIDDFILDDIVDNYPVEKVESNLTGESLSNEEVELIIPKCEFLTGGAGTGKTYEIKRRMEAYREEFPDRDRRYGILAASTGIAAINLGDDTSTINSLLKYFDVTSLEENYNSGKLHNSLIELSRNADWLILDEISMIHAKVLDIIWDGLVYVNQLQEVQDRGGLGIILVGDFCQLPPVPEKDRYDKPIEAKYAFESLCWKYFDKNTTRLTKVWRQDDIRFVKALDSARRGDGGNCAAQLKSHSEVTFCQELKGDFDGTTIFSKNVEVDRYNQTRLRNLLYNGKKQYTVKSFRWGKQRGEWKNIPETLELCEDCYVMILANDSKMNGFRYANGTTGYVKDFSDSNGVIGDKSDSLAMGKGAKSVKEKIDIEDCFKVDTDDDDDRINADIADAEGEGEVKLDKEDYYRTRNTFLIKLKDKGLEVEIGKICRQVMVKDYPDDNRIKVEKPKYDTLKEWKEKHSNEYESSKQAKFLYETQYLRELTEEGKKRSHRIIHAADSFHTQGCTCGWLGKGGLEEWQEHKKQASPEIFFDYNEGKWVIGEIYYYPIRIAYASTVHKSQGLTLDMVQIDFSNKFFSQPSMAYVALSRVRSAKGLRIVGGGRFEDKINVSRKVVRFI